jgi:NADH-quinone oxidoreductase subunit J
MEAFFFYLFGGIAIAAALLVITRRNPVTSAIFLILCLFSLAVLYVLLRAHFVAVIQVLVYAGAIMVLFLFVIMLLNLSRVESGRIRNLLVKVVGAVLGVVLMINLLAAVNKPLLPEGARLSEGFGGTEQVGMLLFSDYLLPFEVASVLLLAAIVGAIILSRREF